MVSLSFQPPVIAHRGASAYAPENTLMAFAKAAQMGVKWVEFDVMQASCGEAIIFHDETLERTTNAKGDVAQYPYAYLRTVDAGGWFDLAFAGERIPTLHQVMQFLLENKMGANVEIKALLGKEEALIVPALKILSPYIDRPDSPVLFSSFSTDALRLLRKHLPNAMIGLLLHEWEPDWEMTCLELNCVSVHVNEEIMTEKAAHKIKSMNKKLLCYTVNDPVRALTLYSWGVDAVFSDAPDRIMRAIAKSEHKAMLTNAEILK